VGGVALATRAAAAPVVGAGLVANQLYERFGEDQGPDGALGSARTRVSCSRDGANAQLGLLARAVLILRLGLGERLLCERVDRSRRPPRLVGWRLLSDHPDRP
jgi:hypothetical protein